ncbi:unnamed protein product [Cyprideis torosa]|uniref:Uncharacterized protein n=1 Tax=Cyprideis torosa TaxID=163714 RepID=A0A7R8W208_9CRUS|nr:unnamed protein product [Cyprideis torosa]CAG0881474.1 unnamed protein product [Cyprideis torosa]
MTTRACLSGGVNSPVYYVREGVPNTYALNFTMTVPADVSDIHFWWENLDKKPVAYDIQIENGNPSALLQPKINISRSGLIPRITKSFRIELQCTGLLNAEVLVTLRLNFTTNKNIFSIELVRKKICLTANFMSLQESGRREASTASDHDDASDSSSSLSSGREKLQEDSPKIQGNENTGDVSSSAFIAVGGVVGAVLTITALFALAYWKNGQRRRESPTRRDLKYESMPSNVFCRPASPTNSLKSGSYATIASFQRVLLADKLPTFPAVSEKSGSSTGSAGRISLERSYKSDSRTMSSSNKQGNSHGGTSGTYNGSSRTGGFMNPREAVTPEPFKYCNHSTSSCSGVPASCNETIYMTPGKGRKKSDLEIWQKEFDSALGRTSEPKRGGNEETSSWNVSDPGYGGLQFFTPPPPSSPPPPVSRSPSPPPQILIPREVDQQPSLSEMLKSLTVDQKHIVAEELLQEGTFGRIYRGTYQKPGFPKEHVMIKTVTGHSSPVQSTLLLGEGLLMFGVSHSNTLPIIGVSVQDRPTLIYPYMNLGNMKLFLNSCRKCHDSQSYPLLTQEVIHFGIQACGGIAHLHQRNIIHKDVAARNCVIFSSTGQHKLDERADTLGTPSPIRTPSDSAMNFAFECLDDKLRLMITDNALARDLFPDDYHCLGDSENRPIKWMPPESICDRKFSSASDVWSYGVFLWELITLAQQPFQEVDPFEMAKFLKDGYRLAQPPRCPDDLFDVMAVCWEALPEDRPTMNQLLIYLQEFESSLGKYI